MKSNDNEFEDIFVFSNSFVDFRFPKSNKMLLMFLVQKMQALFPKVWKTPAMQALPINGGGG